MYKLYLQYRWKQGFSSDISPQSLGGLKRLITPPCITYCRWASASLMSTTLLPPLDRRNCCFFNLHTLLYLTRSPVSLNRPKTFSTLASHKVSPILAKMAFETKATIASFGGKLLKLQHDSEHLFPPAFPSPKAITESRLLLRHIHENSHVPKPLPPTSIDLR
jgi:hypothetical protein